MTDPAATPPIPPARVLVVDDEAHVCSSLARSLSLLGYSADAATSGHQALEMLGRALYDAMVLDIRMPGMDGVEVMHRAHQMCPDLSIVVLTGHARLDSAIAAVKSHAADYLLKPVDAKDVAAALADALRQRAVERRGRRLLELIDHTLHETRKIAAPAETPPTHERFLRAGPLMLDRKMHLVAVVGSGDAASRRAQLTATEAALLACLMEHPNAALSCRELARSALGYDIAEEDAQSIVRPHICRVRKKIEPDPADPRLIRTVPRQGYSFTP